MTNGRPFTDVLREVEGGRLVNDLTAEVYKLIEAVRDTRRSGQLKLTLSFSPTGRGTIEVNSKVDVKAPEDPRPSTTFFTTPENTLVRDDPSQPNLPLQVVPRDHQAPVRVADEDQPRRRADID